MAAICLLFKQLRMIKHVHEASRQDCPSGQVWLFGSKNVSAAVFDETVQKRAPTLSLEKQHWAWSVTAFVLVTLVYLSRRQSPRRAQPYGEHV